MDTHQLNSTPNNPYAAALRRLAALGFGPEAPSPAPPPEPSREVNGDYPADDPEVLNWISEGNPNHRGHSS